MADIIRSNRDFLRYCAEGIDRQAEGYAKKPATVAQLTAASLLRQAAESIRAALRTTAQVVVVKRGGSKTRCGFEEPGPITHEYSDGPLGAGDGEMP